MSSATIVKEGIRTLGRRAMEIIGGMGSAAIFLIESVRWIFAPPWRFSLLIRQIYIIGTGSLSIVLLTGLFTGMVLALQGIYAFRKFGSEAFLGPAVAFSLIRELGPVLTALVVTGRAGSAMTAEIGIMQITEQVDALKSMAVNPLQRLVSPRLLAGVIVFPLLTALCDLIGIFGAYLVGVELMGVSSGTFFGEMQDKIEMVDINVGLWKSIVFGLIVTWVCCYKGYHCGHGAEGVGKATTSAVVLSSVLILVGDYFLTSILI